MLVVMEHLAATHCKGRGGEVRRWGGNKHGGQHGVLYVLLPVVVVVMPVTMPAMVMRGWVAGHGVVAWRHGA